MHPDNIKEENGQYTVVDSTSGGYVDRMNYSLTQNWVSVWDKDLNFISLKNQWHELTDVLNKKDKSHEDYYKGVRAKNRHLKMLKEHLGISTELKKVVNKKTDTIIYLEKGPYSKLDNLSIQPAIIHDQTIEISGRGLIKKHNLHYTSNSLMNEELMNIYNKKLEEFLEFRKFVFKELFKGR